MGTPREEAEPAAHSTPNTASPALQLPAQPGHGHWDWKVWFAWTGEVWAIPAEPQGQGSFQEVQKHLEGMGRRRGVRKCCFIVLFSIYWFCISLRFTGHLSLSLCTCQRCQRFQTLCWNLSGTSASFLCPALCSWAGPSRPASLPVAHNPFCCFCSCTEIHPPLWAFRAVSCKFSRRWIVSTAFRNEALWNLNRLASAKANPAVVTWWHYCTLIAGAWTICFTLKYEDGGILIILYYSSTLWWISSCNMGFLGKAQQATVFSLVSVSQKQCPSLKNLVSVKTRKCSSPLISEFVSLKRLSSS